MEQYGVERRSAVVVGNGKLAYSITACFLQAGCAVRLITDDAGDAKDWLYRRLPVNAPMPEICRDLPGRLFAELIVVANKEDLAEKKEVICQLENSVPEDAIIAVAIESFTLDEVQSGSRFPGRIVGLNWTYPAHTTFFAEVIANVVSEAGKVADLTGMLRRLLKKDPYVVAAGFSIRSRMLAALVREAFFLVENGYATIESIDRSCRNDAGSYLPFAGNFRYMDLMGTGAYGVVMNDLNKELADNREPGQLFLEFRSRQLEGMKAGNGFYDYKQNEYTQWEQLYEKFSNDIRKLMEQYPASFEHPEKNK